MATYYVTAQVVDSFRERATTVYYTESAASGDAAVTAAAAQIAVDFPTERVTVKGVSLDVPPVDGDFGQCNQQHP